MRNIEPIRYTDEDVLSTQIRVGIVEDDLATFSRFAWWLFTAEGAPVDSGVIICDGDNYLSWDGNNEFPYEYTATTIGVVLIP